MELRADEAELYALFKKSPLVTEATKLIAEAKDGIGLTEIANRLHKKSPTVHRALQKLKALSLVGITREGRTATYRIRPTKKNTVNRILAQVYHPTISFVIGELSPSSPKENMIENGEVKGTCFNHKVDVLYEYYEDTEKADHLEVAIDVLDKLRRKDILALAGKMLDIDVADLDGYLIIVVEDGSSREDFSTLERLLDTVKDKLNTPVDAIFIERKTPLDTVREARDLLNSMLRR